MTIVEKIRAHLLEHHHQSATQIAKAINEKVASVASLCIHEVHAGRLCRVKTLKLHGPKGGFVYYLPEKP